MINFFARNLAKCLLWLRYDIQLTGLDAIEAKGKTGIVFLPNHPALIDPVIHFSCLQGKFAPHAIGDVDQLERPVIGYFAKRMGVRTVPSVATYGPAAKSEIERVLNITIEGLKKGENLLLWPSGRLYHTNKESLGANSSVERIIKV